METDHLAWSARASPPAAILNMVHTRSKLKSAVSQTDTVEEKEEGVEPREPDTMTRGHHTTVTGANRSDDRGVTLVFQFLVSVHTTTHREFPRPHYTWVVC